MNIERAKARRHEIYQEQEALFGGDLNRSLSPTDQRTFDKLQRDFEKFDAEVRQYERVHGKTASPDGIRPNAWGSHGGFDNEPGAAWRAWGRQVANDMLERRALDETVGGTATAPFFDSNLRTLPWAANSVRALIPTVQTESSPVLAIKQKTRTNNAAVVAPGATKPTTVLGVERVEVAIKVVAHVSEPIDRMLLMDNSQLETFLTNEMRLGVLAGTEDQILNGNGTGNNFAGLLTSVTAVETVGPVNEIDTIMKAIGNVRASLYEPDAIVVSQDDYENLRLGKDANEQYYGGGPFDELEGDRLWGKKLVVSPLLASGIGIVGAFEAGATVYDRMQARVDWAQTGFVDATPDVDLFTTNQVRARGEERLGFLVHRPSAFCKVDFIP